MVNLVDPIEKRKALAESFFRGVYGGNPSVVDELGAVDIVASYPIFQKIFGMSAIRGIEAYRKHAVNFNSTWEDAEITVHRAVAEGGFVVLLWSFRAHRAGSERPESSTASQKHSWGGVTLFEFNTDDKIIAEIGEESEPGPLERLATTGK